MAVEHTIWCDECGELGDASRESATAARKKMRAEKRGWIRIGNLDICPKCLHGETSD